MPKSLDDLVAHADRLADQFEDYEPDPADRIDEPPLMALRRAAYRRGLVEKELLESVQLARRSGATWAQVGRELGTSGEAARQRYAHHVDAGA